MAVLSSETTAVIIEEGISATNGSRSGVAIRIIIAGLVLVAIAVGAKRWFYPFTIDDLEHEIRMAFKVLQDNTTLELDLLGDFAARSQKRLAVYVVHPSLTGGVEGPADEYYLMQRIQKDARDKR